MLGEVLIWRCDPSISTDHRTSFSFLFLVTAVNFIETVYVSEHSSYFSLDFGGEELFLSKRRLMNDILLIVIIPLLLKMFI